MGGTSDDANHGPGPHPPVAPRFGADSHSWENYEIKWNDTSPSVCGTQYLCPTCLQSEQGLSCRGLDFTWEAYRRTLTSCLLNGTYWGRSRGDSPQAP